MHARRQNKKVAHDSILKRKGLPIIALIIIVFVYYGNTLKNAYSLDDDLVTTTDNSVHERVEKGISAIPEIFRTRYVHNEKQKYEYRPVTTSSFAVEYSFFGDKTLAERATISHLISVMLYALLVVLIYLLIFKLFPDKGWIFPFLVSMLFLIHPIHSEVVNNIKCRDELFVIIFGIMGLFSFLKYLDFEQKKKRYLLLGVLMVILSILSKKVGIAFVVLIPLTLYYFRDIKVKKLLILFGLMFAGIFVFYFLKKTALSDSVVREKMFFENPLYFAESNLERIPMFFYSIMYYLKMMVFPAPLVYYYGYDQIEIVGWSNPFVWVGVLFVFSGVFFAIKRIRKKEMWAFGFLFFMFGVGGGANLLFPAVGIVAERFVFTASFGLIFLAVYYAFMFYEKKKWAKQKLFFYGVGGGIILLSFSQVVDRNGDWKSRFSLYKHDIENLSMSAKAHSLLGTEYVRVADSILRMPNTTYATYLNYVDTAIMEFIACTEIYPGYHNASNNAGALYFTRKKNHYKAKPLFLKAIHSRPDYVEALFNYGNCLQYDLKGVKELQMIIGDMGLDSINKDEIIIKTQDYTEELRSAFAINFIKTEIRKILGEIKINQLNWKEIAMDKILLSINTFLNVEAGELRARFNQIEYNAKLSSYFNSVNSENGLNSLKEFMSYTEMYFSNLIKESLIKQFRLDSNYFDLLKLNLLKQEKETYDSIQYYWNEALTVDKSYYYCYKSLADLYLKVSDFDRFIEINKKAILHGEFETNTEFYLNIGNAYNAQSNFSEAIVYMEKAVGEIDETYIQLYNRNLENSQSRLMGLLNQKKQILGFISNIYYTTGDHEKAVKYQKILEQI